MPFIEICPFSRLLTHFRFFLTLRSAEGSYHSLILFRLTPISYSSTPPDQTNGKSRDSPSEHNIYVMESSCPHLGADMSHADIEDCDDSVVAVCPWHGYDFDLRTGKSETGMRACTYGVDVRSDPNDGELKVWIETPESGSQWRLVELRPVSEEFADPPAPVACPQNKALPTTGQSAESVDRQEEPVVPTLNPPTTLMQWAVLILNTSDPAMKVERTRHAVNLFRTGKLTSIGHKSSNAPKPPDIPPREDHFLRNTVDPGKVKNRKNRAVMLHALANIEQWAIDLAWDIMARFGPVHPDLPHAFFSDFTKMALDEAKHFSLLTQRLTAISPSTPYGTLPVHASLWESASITSTSLRSRLAIIHLVHEARGLDVNPATIERFRRAGDMDSVHTMEIIHADEVTHVTSGHRWFTWICQKGDDTNGPVDPVAAFREEVHRGWRGDIKGPFNAEDREKAGLTPAFYEGLKGELDLDTTNITDSLGKLQVGYE